MRVARGGSPPYFAHKYFVEADFATEAVQALYRTANVTIGNAQYLGHYLENDILGTQCIPRDHIGRFLRICMEAPKDLHDKLGYTKFVKYLNPLFQVKHISSLRIKLILVLDIPFYDRDCDVFSVRFEEILAPTVHRLKKLGAKIQWLRMDSEVMVSSLVQMRERDATQSLEELEKDIAAHSVFKQPINDNAW
ncbi:hypothetical protein P3342_012224 [Pyrenophora teres f. teres]|uniref:Uncharacterized protein n=2 Tax=Pyrenophora teres f. teres TaxID=97479 RepID=E3RVT6_PYRTT|nr:hypothetical protein PTT_13317 [Pyrenophora teres f. teres 0-1]KAE8824083.1 hypothetical protein HRS9139_09265 [Pyrenophora teres f. teres]KAE8827286.1 hypothetical protein PTNB85_08639 [Pyrenophora teres f. teres]KAE8831418.1 hypothetical protein HRS9122_09008 [Pyrenophora teres f. teres]KAE8855140.1 hypothetical protein PTNB29_09391 [Pyrenophora teres f. teres]